MSWWIQAKLIRIENGQVSISKQGLTELLQYYGVTEPVRVQELHQLARASRQRMWWSKYQRHLSASFLEFLGAEFDAVRVQYVQALIIPGIIQTRVYAQAINDATFTADPTDEMVQARVEVRLLRQQELLQRRGAPEIVTIIDEAAFRRPVGGSETMLEQIDHIISLAQRKAIDLVVLPFTIGPHLGMTGPFTLMEYQEEQDEDVVSVENAAGGMMLRDEPETVVTYRREVERMARVGLRGKEAVSFVRSLRKELFE